MLRFAFASVNVCGLDGRFCMGSDVDVGALVLGGFYGFLICLMFIGLILYFGLC